MKAKVLSFLMVALLATVACDHQGQHAAAANGSKGKPGAGAGLNAKRGESASRVTALRDVLTKDAWAKSLGNMGRGDAGSREYVIYRFMPDGSYEKTARTDHSVPTERGSWELSEDRAGLIHLALKGSVEPEKMYWLGSDNIVEYDSASDTVLVSGERFVGKQPLIRWASGGPATRLATQAAGVSNDIDEIREQLLASSWTSSYRQGSQRVTWFYSFFEEGRVVFTQQTDSVTRTEGTWQLSGVGNGQVHLLLNNTEGRDSRLEVAIYHDKTNDSIVLSSLSGPTRSTFTRAATVPRR